MNVDFHIGAEGLPGGGIQPDGNRDEAHWTSDEKLKRCAAQRFVNGRVEGTGPVMIVCSCTVITDRDIESALVEILNRPNAPIPTPGVVYRHLQKRMNCCGCAPLAVDTIYNKVDELERKGLISPNVCEVTRSKLLEFSVWRARLRAEKPAGVAADKSTRKVA